MKIFSEYRRKFIPVFTLLIAIFISIGFMLSVSRVSHAESGESDLSVSTLAPVYVVNPLYADIVSESDLNKFSGQTIDAETLNDATKCTTVAEMVSILRSAMVNRTESVVVYYELPGTSYSAQELINMESSVLDEAIVHTGKGNEGDYLKWAYSGLGMQISYGKTSGNTVGSFSYYFTYYTNASQESQVTSKVNQISSQLALSSASEIEKVTKVYEYVVSNVKYDRGSSNIKYSCYAAAINNSAVCQGYSLLIYRLLNDAGIDCRLIAGNTSSGSHGWNIVKINNLYYNLDSTWDAGKSSSNYSYFLKCDSNFKDHTRWSDYSSASFNASYPMSTADYKIDNLDSEEIESIKLKTESIVLKVGESKTIKLTTKPSDSKENVVFKSSKKKIAVVDDSGVVTGKKAGTCEITVSNEDGSIYDKCYVTVKSSKKVAVKSVKLSKKKLSLSVGSTYTLKVKIKPNSATNKKVVFKSSNKKIATVDKNGKIKAKKKGTCIITVKTKDGKKTAKCKVKVK